MSFSSRALEVDLEGLTRDGQGLAELVEGDLSLGLAPDVHDDEAGALVDGVDLGLDDLSGADVDDGLVQALGEVLEGLIAELVGDHSLELFGVEFVLADAARGDGHGKELGGLRPVRAGRALYPGAPVLGGARGGRQGSMNCLRGAPARAGTIGPWGPRTPVPGASDRGAGDPPARNEAHRFTAGTPREEGPAADSPPPGKIWGGEGPRAQAARGGNGLRARPGP